MPSKCFDEIDEKQMKTIRHISVGVSGFKMNEVTEGPGVVPGLLRP